MSQNCFLAHSSIKVENKNHSKLVFGQSGGGMMNIYPLKIIWNITNKCGYDCEICATRSDRDELILEGKKRVLNSILSIGIQDIMEIDFAGGDPLFSVDSVKIIHDTINILGKEKVSVTTTGKGIDATIRMGEDLSQLLYNCEITIDSLSDVQNYLRNDFSYVVTNQDAIRHVHNSITNLTINIPILTPGMDNNSIQKLVDQIAGIDVGNISVNLIRLMNVGLMSSRPNYSFYSPVNFVKKFIEYAKNTCIKNIHIHCALRGKVTNSQCNMLNHKIGIDCSGNVFACAWGGYLLGFDKHNIDSNPFYLGNLLEKPLLEVLINKRAVQLKYMIQENPTNHCRVYCFNNNDIFSIFKDTDPLFS